VTEQLARDPHRQIVEATIGVAGGLRDARLVSASDLAQYQRWIRDMYGRRARELGLNARRGEPEESKLLRSSLFKVLGDAGDDPEVVSLARNMTRSWLADHASIDVTLADAALLVAAQHGDRALFDAMHAAARRERDRRARELLLDAMGSFRDPVVARDAMRIALTDEFPAREAIVLVYAATHSEATQGPAYDFVREHFGELVGKLPAREGAGLVSAGAALCDESKRAEVEAFFQRRIAELPGGPRRYAQAVEQLRTCAAVRTAQAPAVARFFATAHAAR
jgi:alanyl aminopeptidase